MTSSSGRDVVEPLAVSVQMRAHPDALSASSCRATSCGPVLTRA